MTWEEAIEYLKQLQEKTDTFDKLTVPQFLDLYAPKTKIGVEKKEEKKRAKKEKEEKEEKPCRKPSQKMLDKLEILTFAGKKRESEMWEEYGAQIRKIVEPHFPKRYVNRYSKADDKDSVSFLAVDSKNEVKGVAICDRWVNLEWDGAIVQPQLYIGLIAAPCYGEVLVQAIVEYAQEHKYKSKSFQFVSALALPHAKEFFIHQGFQPGYGKDVKCSARGRSRKGKESNYKLELDGYPMHLCLQR